MGDPEHQPIDAPPVTVTAILGTTALNADGTPQDPADISGGGEVVPSTSIRLRFDRFLLPASVSRQALCLRSNTAEVADFTECSGSVFVQPSYDPVRREVVLRLEAGDRLALGTTYRLTLFAAQGEVECDTDVPTTCGLRAFDRAPLDKVYTFTITTVAADPGTALDETLPDAVFCGADGAARALGNTCAYGRCHAPMDGGPGSAAGLSFAGIQFDDPTATRATAINQVAHTTMMGESAAEPEGTPARFGRAMPIIDAFDADQAGSPGNSYLLYKLLTGMSVDEAPDDIRPSDEEIARLLDSVVVGMPMPVPDSATGPLRPVQLTNLSNWIARGAPMPTCN